MNAILLTNKGSEREVEKAKYSELIICLFDSNISDISVGFLFTEFLVAFVHLHQSEMDARVSRA